MGEPSFTRRVIAWHRQHGRHDLPWQQPRTPWRVWVSEIMLQQTQVKTVVAYFQRFMEQFPDPVALACAEEDRVLKFWQGLGYYSRARNLHQAAKQVVARHDGRVPATYDALLDLKGIGPSTAGAILSLGFQLPGVILDGNVKRVLTRHAGIRQWPGERSTEKQLWSLAETFASKADPVAWTQGIMDLGATVCTPRQAQCTHCPLSSDCEARRLDLQQAIPARRPRRVLPEREALFLWLQRTTDQALWLCKRPAKGIWGGLWCLPQSDYDLPIASARVALAEQLSVTGHALVDQGNLTEGFQHTFTHFKLRARILHLSAAAEVTPACSMQARWFSAREALPPLPAPIARLIAERRIVGSDQAILEWNQ